LNQARRGRSGRGTEPDSQVTPLSHGRGNLSSNNMDGKNGAAGVGDAFVMLQWQHTKSGIGKSTARATHGEGNKYREFLIKERRAAEEKVRKKLSADEIAALLRLLKVIAEVKF
jgi:hypothetical protein